MPKKITISPVTRINGFWRLDVHVDNGKVVDAYSNGIYTRGLEKILEQRAPKDAVYLSQRICGICSSAHAVTGSLAVEQAYNLKVPRNGVLIRNMIYGADLLQNHIRHFYFLTIPDFAEGPDEPPFTPRYKAEYKFSKGETDRLYQNYMESIDLSRKCHEMLTIYGGKAPHNHGILPGGSTVPPTADNIRLFLSRLQQVTKFINEKMVPDMELLARRYPEYYQIGQGPEVMISYGMFQREDKEKEFYFKPGVVINGEVHKLNHKLISEKVKYSWYKDEDAAEDIMKADTHLEPEKEGAYSWIKAPRYQGKSVQTGPLSRLWITGDYRNGISTMDRLYARVLEAKKVALLMEEWAHKLEPGKPIYNKHKPLRNGTGIGLFEAMRGALGHWVEIENYRVKKYQVITPSAWNMSPRDDDEQLGAVEQSLLGTPVADTENPIEIGRVARSFDPCSSCGAQLITPEGSIKEFII